MLSIFSEANQAGWSLVYNSTTLQWVVLFALLLAASMGVGCWKRLVPFRTISLTIFAVSMGQLPLHDAVRVLEAELAILQTPLCNPQGQEWIVVHQVRNAEQTRLLAGETVAIKVLSTGRVAIGEVLEVSGRKIVLNSTRVLLPDSPVRLSWETDNFVLGVVRYCIARNIPPAGDYKAVVIAYHAVFGSERKGNGLKAA